MRLWGPECPEADEPRAVLREPHHGPEGRLVLDADGTELRVRKVRAVAPPPYTELGWQARDIEAMARQLSERGVSLERYDGLLQGELGIWSAPDGSRVAWCRGHDANTLSLTQRGGMRWAQSV